MKVIRYLFAAVASITLHGFSFSDVPVTTSIAPIEQARISLSLQPIRVSSNTEQLEPVNEKLDTDANVKQPTPVPLTAPDKTDLVQENTTKKTIEPLKKPALQPAQQKPKPIDAANMSQPRAVKPKTTPLPKTKPREPEKLTKASMAETAITKSELAINDDQEPVLIEKPRFKTQPKAPNYPAMARRRGMEGEILIEIWLDESGNQTKQILVKSSGFSLLDKAALNAVTKWQFHAYKQHGRAKAHKVRIPIEFKLD